LSTPLSHPRKSSRANDLVYTHRKIHVHRDSVADSLYCIAMSTSAANEPEQCMYLPVAPSPSVEGRVSIASVPY